MGRRQRRDRLGCARLVQAAGRRRGCGPGVHAADHAHRREAVPGHDARPLEAARPARGRGWRDGRRPVTAARREAPGREGRAAVRDRAAAARVEADRRPQHLRRRQPAGPDRGDDLDHDQRPRDRRATSTSARASPAATRRRSASRRSSPAGSATAPSSSSTASSRRTARRARSRSSTCCSAPATTTSTSRERSTPTFR